MEVVTQMGVLKKVGVVIGLYVILGVIFYLLIQNDIVSIHENNFFVDILYTIFSPVIIATNFLYVTLPFVP
jgi:hypothetical protein